MNKKNSENKWNNNFYKRIFIQKKHQDSSEFSKKKCFTQKQLVIIEILALPFVRDAVFFSLKEYKLHEKVPSTLTVRPEAPKLIETGLKDMGLDCLVYKEVYVSPFPSIQITSTPYINSSGTASVVSKYANCIEPEKYLFTTESRLVRTVSNKL